MDLGRYCLRDGLDFQKTGEACLSWAQRIQIALDIAEALAYMHQELSPAVVHCDVTARNILIMDDMRACISDFGLAKELPRDGNLTVEEVRSTFGYIAPELASLGHLSAKADAFSFGVLLLEIFTAQHPVDTLRPKGKHLLVELLRPLLSGHLKIGDVLDRHLHGTCSLPQLAVLQDAVCSCLRFNPIHRSTVADVLPLLRDLHQTALEPQNVASTRPRDSASEMTGFTQKSQAQPGMIPTRSANIEPALRHPSELRTTFSATVPDHDNPFSTLKGLNLFSPMVGRAFPPPSTAPCHAVSAEAQGASSGDQPRDRHETAAFQVDGLQQCSTLAANQDTMESMSRVAHDILSDPSTTCLLCMSGTRDMELRPCGHRVTCSHCTLALASAAGRCPTCSSAVTGFHSSRTQQLSVWGVASSAAPAHPPSATV